MTKLNLFTTFSHRPALALAPMAGITDKPFRQMAKRYGADYAVSEMLTSDPNLQHTRKSLYRRNHCGETGMIAVQIAGSDPEQLAMAARYNVDCGAQVIDINMGCPAKKVCNVFSGSALLQNEPLVERILNAVVQAVDVPVTLKTRLGWDDAHRNIVTVAKMAEQAGIHAIAIHGRTRTQMYQGEADYDLITQVKQIVNIPVWANGDITTPQKAAQVWAKTGTDGLMIGRGAQGRPWLFGQIRHFLDTGEWLPLSFQAASEIILTHIQAMYDFYGEQAGVRMARKHIGWYLARIPDSEQVRKHINQLPSSSEQWTVLTQFLMHCGQEYDFWQDDVIVENRQ